MIAGFPIAAAAVASEILFAQQVCGHVSCGVTASPYNVSCGGLASVSDTVTASAAEGIVSGGDGRC